MKAFRALAFFSLGSFFVVACGGTHSASTDGDASPALDALDALDADKDTDQDTESDTQEGPPRDPKCPATAEEAQSNVCRGADGVTCAYKKKCPCGVPVDVACTCKKAYPADSDPGWSCTDSFAVFKTCEALCPDRPKCPASAPVVGSSCPDTRLSCRYGPDTHCPCGDFPTECTCPDPARTWKCAPPNCTEKCAVFDAGG